MRPEINHDAHIRVGTCGSCGGPVVIYTGPWRSRERVCRHCGVAPATPHIDKCQCPDCEPSKYPRKACDRGALNPVGGKSNIRWNKLGVLASTELMSADLTDRQWGERTLRVMGQIERGGMSNG